MSGRIARGAGSQAGSRRDRTEPGHGPGAASADQGTKVGERGARTLVLGQPAGKVPGSRGVAASLSTLPMGPLPWGLTAHPYQISG